MSKKQVCLESGASFQITDTELEFYQQMGVNLPRLSPDVRGMRRLAWRNERTLYRRACDLSGVQTISFYPQDSTHKVYAQKEWWSDKWSAIDYGLKFDRSKPFLTQFKQLLASVPHMAMQISHGENSDYCPYSVYYKDSYMCVSGMYSEDCMYCYHCSYCKDCVDCLMTYESELCYECSHCTKLYNSIFCMRCDNSSDLYFCTDCSSCKNCIGCFGLRNKEYHIFNVACSKQEYENFLLDIKSSYVFLQDTLRRHQKFQLKLPHRSRKTINCNDVVGDYLYNSKNLYECFNCRNLEDSAYCWNNPKGSHMLYDTCFSDAEYCYNCISAVGSNNCISCAYCWDTSDVSYSFQCFYSKYLLGCVGLRNQEYCVLNTQYSREDYEAIHSLIKTEMSEKGIWGEFFPADSSPFPYNDTIAPYYFPLTEKEAQFYSYSWRREDQTRIVEQTVEVPESIEEVSDEVTGYILKCEDLPKNYKIIAQELKFYRKMSLPIPTKSPEARYRMRLARENPRKLYNRKCDKTGAEIITTYKPEDPRAVYAEEAYVNEVF